jgi:SagB-type dehydrogenase family enzyme
MQTPQTLQVTPYIFFLLKNGKTIIWDYKNHHQFELEETYLQRLKEISAQGGAVKGESPLDQELFDAGLIVPASPDVHWQWDELGKIYHIGTQDICGKVIAEEQEWLEDYYAFCKEIAGGQEYTYISHEGEKVFLPDPKLDALEEVRLSAALRERMTSRIFNGNPISFEQLSTLLFCSFGLIHGEWQELVENNLRPLGIRKAHPSGGGLHPVEAYILAFNVEGMMPGIYHYDVKGHHLTRVNAPCSYDHLKYILCGQFFAQGISVGVFLTAHFEKVWKKYVHSRSYKDVYLDAGHASQTFLLTATALNLRTWESAWFQDTEVASLLKIDGVSAAPLFFLAVGHGDKKAIPEKLEELIKAKATRTQEL